MKLPRIDKGPELKLPKLSKPKLRRDGGSQKADMAPAAGASAPKRPKRQGPSLGEKVPAPIADLVRDLRDRRLLFPAIALIVALIAVPLLLARPDEDPVLPAAVPVSADADAVAPAVLVDSSGVRDYEQRLKNLKSRNPFSAPAGVNLGAEGDGGTGDGLTVVEEGGDELVDTGDPIGDAFPEAPVEVPDTGTSSPPAAPTDSAGTPDTGDGGDGDGGGGNGGQSGGDPKPEIRYVEQTISYEVDASISEDGGDPATKKDLEFMQVLPSESKPAAAFVGVDDSGRRAAFLVGRDVTQVGGEGRCYPNPTDCQWLLLEESETASLTYQPEDAATPTQFDLVVTSVQKVKERVKD